MSASIPLEPDQSGSVIYVGRDRAGHWLVQDDQKRLEGCFVSYAAAMSYAQGERHFYHARVEVCETLLTPVITYGSLGAPDAAIRCAA